MANFSPRCTWCGAYGRELYCCSDESCAHEICPSCIEDQRGNGFLARMVEEGKEFVCPSCSQKIEGTQDSDGARGRKIRFTEPMEELLGFAFHPDEYDRTKIDYKNACYTPPRLIGEDDEEEEESDEEEDEEEEEEEGGDDKENEADPEHAAAMANGPWFITSGTEVHVDELDKWLGSEVARPLFCPELLDLDFGNPQIESPTSVGQLSTFDLDVSSFDLLSSELEKHRHKRQKVCAV